MAPNMYFANGVIFFFNMKTLLQLLLLQLFISSKCVGLQLKYDSLQGGTVPLRKMGIYTLYNEMHFDKSV